MGTSELNRALGISLNYRPVDQQHKTVVGDEDIIVRLRQDGNPALWDDQRREAAAEIVRLRSALAQISAKPPDHCPGDSMEDAHAHLREAPTIEKRAKSLWDAERKLLAETAPDWPMPAWSRAPAWRRRPYVLTAREADEPAEEAA
jgi:hypothetical protein